MEKEVENETGRMMYGTWCCIESELETTVSINQTQTTVTIKRSNIVIKEESVQTKNWWLGEQLVFGTEQKYYLKYANENKLIFGERNPLIGDIIWEKQFGRLCMLVSV